MHGKRNPVAAVMNGWIGVLARAPSVGMAPDRAKGTCAPSPGGLSTAAIDRGEGDVLFLRPPFAFMHGCLVG